VIRVVALLVAGYSVFMLSHSVSPAMWGSIPLGLLGLVAAAGLVAGRRWSEPVTYVFVWLIAGSWIAIVAAQSLTWRRDARVPGVLEFVPGMLFVLLCAASGVLVFRHFRRER
jgi:hypothetical protein